MDYLKLFIDAILGTINWTWRSVVFEVPWQRNYFWGLIAISLFVFGLELLFPWRKNQKAIRKDFWLDGFYMFFNFFIDTRSIFFIFYNKYGYCFVTFLDTLFK